MDTGDGHDKPAEAKNESEQMQETRGNAQTEQSADKSCSRKSDEASGKGEKENVQHDGSSSSTSHARRSSNARSANANPDEVQMDPQDGEVNTDKRERSGSMQIEQPGPEELLEKKHKGSASTTVATERLEKRHKRNDIGMIDDKVTVPGGQQVHTNAGTIRGCEDDQEDIAGLHHEGAGGEGPDTMVTLSATVSEQEPDTRADVEESMSFVMRMCEDQISCNKYFAHVWLRWSVEGLEHARSIKVDECEQRANS